MSLEESEEFLGAIATAIDELLNEDGERVNGFCLLTFEFNRPGISNYVSNAKREDMIRALEETLLRLKNKEDIPRAQGHA